MERKKIRNDFYEDELVCRCGCGRANYNDDSLDRLQASRDDYGNVITITCGSRCAKHNKEVLGAPKSSHLDEPELSVLPYAFDIACVSNAERYPLVNSLMKHFPRVWIYPRHVHVDNDPGKAWPRLALGSYAPHPVT